MIPGLGKQQHHDRQRPTCDVVLVAPGILPEHARIVNQGVASCSSPAGKGRRRRTGGRICAGEQVPFDFRTQFVVAQTPVPLNHPAITLMLASPGHARARRPARS